MEPGVCGWPVEPPPGAPSPRGDRARSPRPHSGSGPREEVEARGPVAEGTRPLSRPASRTPCAPAGMERLALWAADGLPWKFRWGLSPGRHRAGRGGHAVPGSAGTEEAVPSLDQSRGVLGTSRGPHTPADLPCTGTNAVRTAPPAAELAC